MSSDEWRKSFYVYDNTVSSLYEACKPEIFEQAPRRLIAVIQYLRGVIDMHVAQADIEVVSQKIAELLDESVVVDNAEKFAVKEHQAEYKVAQKGKVWDLSKLNFDKLKEEDARHVREGLAEDELELYDTLRKDKLSKDEEQKVKLAAKYLINRLLDEHPEVLVQDRWKDGQTQRKVKAAVEEVLDQDLPDSYDRMTFKEKSDNVFDLIVMFAANGRKWAA